MMYRCYQLFQNLIVVFTLGKYDYRLRRFCPIEKVSQGVAFWHCLEELPCNFISIFFPFGPFKD